jgi:hypothetical protein
MDLEVFQHFSPGLVRPSAGQEHEVGERGVKIGIESTPHFHSFAEAEHVIFADELDESVVPHIGAAALAAMPFPDMVMPLVTAGELKSRLAAGTADKL